MASFTAGTTFVDGVSNDVTAAKLGALVTNATPTSGFIQDRTAETVTATNDTLLIGDASDSNNLKRITVANFAQTLPTAKVTTGTIDTGTFGTTTSTAATITTGTITTGVIPTLTTGTTTSTAANITNGTVQTLTASTANITQGSAILTQGTIATLNSTTGTITNLSATTSTFLGTITGSTNVVNIGSGQIYKDTSGNVGVGTASPAAKFHVSGVGIYNAGSGSASGIDFAGNGNTAYTNSLFVGQLTTGVSAIYERGANPLTFYTQSTERLRIDSSGNVAVGAAPSGSFKFEIVGGRSSFSAPSDQYAVGARYVSTGGIVYFGATSSTATPDAAISNAAGSTLMTLQNGGNVGIGTTTPVNKLEIVGSFGRGAPVTKTADFTLADTENWIIVNKGSAGTATLPAASSWTGREFTIKVITAHTVVSASSNVVPRNSTTAGTAILAAAAGNWATLVSNGTNWVAMCGS